MNVYEKIKKESNNFDEMVKLMRQYWKELDEKNESSTNGEKTRAWFKEKGYDIPYDELNDIWDAAADPSDEDEDAPLSIDGRVFKTKEDAKQWLNEKTSEYGNTYFFPDKEKSILNQLITKFGNTYFW